MANTKISQLPIYTGDTTGVFVVMNSADLSTTYRVAKENLTGVSGSNGSSGTSGSSGSSGSNGSSGTSGTSGSNGSSGSSGSSGSNGSSGTSGSSGTAGTSGTSGTSGLVTLTGSTAGGLITYNGSGTNATVQSGVTYSGTTLTAPTGSFDNVIVNGQPTTYGVVNGSYLLAQNNAEQTSVGNGTAISFQTTSASNGSLITKGSNTQVTLTAGNTYKLEAIIRRFTSTSTWGAFRWYDVTNSTYVGVEAFGEVTTSGAGVASTGIATHYVTPSVNTTYELRQTTVNTITVSSAYASIEITQINPTIAVQATATGTMNGTVFALNAISGLTTTSDVNVGGNLNVTGTGGNVLTKTTGTWTVPTGASTQSFTVESGASYTMWVNGNIPNGIITWNATVTTSNTNVPAVGSQYGWYYTPGNALVLTAMPDQIIGTNGSIANTPTAYAPNTSNVFKFGITNNSGTSQTINYGYIKLS